MTAEGLINLFPGLKVLETDVPDYFHPMAALTWICGGYLQGLPDNLKENFLQMSVRELLYYFGNGKSKDHLLFTQLSKDAQIANACGTFIRAVKPEE
jgi:hypothetical protein